MELENKQENNIYEGLGDLDKKVQLEDKKRSLRPVWKDDAGCDLQRMKGCDLLATKK